MTITQAAQVVAPQPHKIMPKLLSKITQERQLHWCLVNRLRISMQQSITTTTMSISLPSLVKATWLHSRTEMPREIKVTMKATILGKRIINRYLINPTVLASIQQWMVAGERRHLRLSMHKNWKLTTPGKAIIIKVSKSALIIQIKVIMPMWKKMKEAHRSKPIHGHKRTLLVTTQIRLQAICLSKHTPRMDLVALSCQVQIRPHLGRASNKCPWGCTIWKPRHSWNLEMSAKNCSVDPQTQTTQQLQIQRPITISNHSRIVMLTIFTISNKVLTS